MNTEKKLAIMRNVYAAAVAEMVNTYGRLQVLEQIVERKADRQAQTSAYMNEQLGVKTVEEVFAALVDIFGCANWKVEKTEEGYAATATACRLSALSKSMGGANPCQGWCLGPMAGMVAAVAKDSALAVDFQVQSTLMDGNCCKVLVMIR